MIKTMLTDNVVTRGPVWPVMTAAMGTVWNAYGVYQFLGSFAQTKQSLMSVGMTAAQAELYLSLPAWISVAFAIGVFGGLAGSVALLLRKALALPLFAVSLAGYIVLFAGDAYFGIFASMPSQLVLLAVVVAIAAALLWAASRAKRQGLLA